METVEVVIKIPKEIYNHTQEYEVGGFNQENDTKLFMAIKKGTVLPKGHGRLIDADALKETFIEPNIYLKGNEKGFWCVTSKKIKNAPIIIEADKGEVKPNMQEPREEFQPPCSDNCHHYEIGEGGRAICTYDAERIIEGEPCHRYKTRGR